MADRAASGLAVGLISGPFTAWRGLIGRRLYQLSRLRDVRLLGYSALILGFVWLAWQILLNATSGSVTREGDAASAWSAGSSAALVRLAERHITQAEDGAVDWAEVARVARKALAADPLQGRALLLLALAAEAGGEAERASALMTLAGERSLRDAGVHLWLFDRHLKEGALADALRHADIVLRSQPELRDRLLPSLIALASQPAAAAEVAELLASNPPWRGWFLRAFARDAENPSAPSLIYASLQSSAHPPSHAEVKFHLDRLIDAGRFQQALLMWLRLVPPLDGLDYLYNGGFEQPISNLPFDWTIRSVRGAEISIAESPVGSGDALRVRFYRARVPFRHVEKLLMLPPGRYQLSGRAKAIALRNERGLWWRVSCADGEHAVLAATERLTGTTAWQAFSIEFVVPAGCQAQWLRLELAARVRLEQEIDGGTVWYDSLQVRRVGARPG